jgi:ATP-dependent Clp protease ATP-binding subunit ClpX
LTQPKNALVNYQRLFEMERVNLTLAEEHSAPSPERRSTARPGRGRSILLDTMFDLPRLEGIEEVMISRQVVEGAAGALYIYAARTGGAKAT